MDLPTFVGSSLIAALVGFLLQRAWAWQDAAAKSRAVLRGMLLELDHLEDIAGKYLRDLQDHPRGWAPAYRPVLEYLGAGPAAVAERGHFIDEEPRHAHRLYIVAAEANRCLEQCALFASEPVVRPLPYQGIIDKALLEQASSRTRIKFSEVLERMPAAREAINTALDRLCWFEPQR